ncbi:hypothetical protein NC651_034572 [Populus alba x Populus x berolinensis]|nr:hypothetical protein NC651_034572 [Populus alba x Populus x berolinensis]
MLFEFHKKGNWLHPRYDTIGLGYARWVCGRSTVFTMFLRFLRVSLYLKLHTPFQHLSVYKDSIISLLHHFQFNYPDLDAQLDILRKQAYYDMFVNHVRTHEKMEKMRTRKVENLECFRAKRINDRTEIYWHQLQEGFFLEVGVPLLMTVSLSLLELEKQRETGRGPGEGY